jgi:integrative and conjugative element protein (TIGR02256 family)
MSSVEARGRTTVWIADDLLEEITSLACDYHPVETGGTFMGWWADSATAVINGLIGAGPAAEHGATHFQPDQDWQLQEIARHYEASGRRETYLGDWHSHPGATSGRISFTDRCVLRRIIGAPAARCPNPLMLIVWGEREQWQMSQWRAGLKRGLIWSRLAVEESDLRPYRSDARRNAVPSDFHDRDD